MKVKEESEKVGLKINIQKAQIMASGLITSQQIDEEKMETVTDLIFLGSRITLDGNCSHEIKKHLVLERTAMTNLDSIFKSRDIPLSIPIWTKVHIVKATVFPVVMYGCESWTVKQFSSVQFSHSVVSDSLRPHELQHARPPCPSPTPGVSTKELMLSNCGVREDS